MNRASFVIQVDQANTSRRLTLRMSCTVTIRPADFEDLPTDQRVPDVVARPVPMSAETVV